MTWTRADLLARVTSTLKRTRTDAELGGFLLSCEEMIASRVRALEMLTRATLTDADRGGDPESPYYTLPADYLDRRALRLLGARGYWLRPASLLELAGVPSNYSAVNYGTNGRELEVRGTPGEGSELGLWYYARPAALVNPTDTHGLLAASGILYLHGTLFWAYLDEEALELATAHKDAFEKEADRLTTNAKRATRAGATSFEVADVLARTY